MGSVRSSGDAELDAAVYAGTLAELGAERKWLRGPFTATELSDLLGPLWVGCRRFGLKQGGKIRLVDDYSEYGVNAATGSSIKFSMHGVDAIASTARAWGAAVHEDGSVELKQIGGPPLRG